MRWDYRVLGLVLVGLTFRVSATAIALPQYARETKAACAACHVNPAGGSALSDVGKAFKAEKKPPAGNAAVAEYVGGTKCKTCHASQYKVWQGSGHAKAFGMLKSASAEKVAEMASALNVEVKGDASMDDNCVVCHVTGFKLAGGYPAADTAKNARLVNVTCESCHGPGSKHVSAVMAQKKKYINRDVSSLMCTQCHTPATSPNFKFEEYKAKIVHWKAK